MRLTKHIPNTITLLNLFCGILAVIFGLKGWLHFSVYLIIAAAIFDFLDGFAARLLKAYSPMGKELDSLADLVSFGLAPSILIYYRFSSFLAPQTHSGNMVVLEILSFTPLLIALFSALRLAKFNIDTRQTTDFIGLATPANALLIAMMLHYSSYNVNLDFVFDNFWFFPLISLVLSLLLVSEIPMFSLKLKSLKFSENKAKYLFFIYSALLVIPVIVTGSKWSLWLFLVLVSYIVYSTFKYLIKAR
ncbi:MAG: CDP-diacylglycerol--serine O-phosphatidyltransferase [Bacteroidetes bacterium HGW-Bacteroidetes-7]|jgi:CDP-diacylglycerol--serine O-phosphatidyltransferase|nr:MAG: CDP-diacylglycerol--serine O-phosphatidyltransferase [Bacteroidetes bacterium HGW-Bacteroidetes-7]